MPEANLVTRRLPTSEGEFVAVYSAQGLAALHFPSNQTYGTTDKRAGRSAPVEQWHRLTSAAVQDILAGRVPGELPPLDLSGGTEFQQRVWRALRKIKTGRTQSYGAIATALNKPRAMRAVGGACGANPIPLLIPCHRVLAANRKIGGFSGGLGWKKKLLAREGVALGQ
jgi:O-6-methylguanine DNA methyltransferase